MANFQLARDGSKKVKEVCVDFRTREDEALAQKLQDEEFETHYLRNRQQRGTARIDVKTAKQTYLKEVKTAGLLEESEYERLAADSAWLASELQQRLDEEEKIEAHNRAAGEMQDEEYAQHLEEKERDRLEKVRRRRLQNRIEKDRQEFNKIEREHLVGRAPEERRPISQPGPSHAEPREERVVEAISANINDLKVSVPQRDKNEDPRLHDFDPVEVTEEEREREQELRDEEYARELQHREEEKLRKLMEERDRRLAMKMQRKEADEYRRKRAEREMRRASSMAESGEKDDASAQASNDEEQIEQRLPHNPEHHEVPKSELQSRRPPDQHYERPFNEQSRSSNVDYTPVKKQADEQPQRSRSSSVKKSAKNDLRQNEAKVQNQNGDPAKSNSQRQQNGTDNSHTEKPFLNVAASIDPTYKGGDEEASTWMNRRWGLDDDESLNPSMPPPVIQNTKRKKSESKKSKEKGEKCKQQ